jgi:hypothetical protein
MGGASADDGELARLLDVLERHFPNRVFRVWLRRGWWRGWLYPRRAGCRR